MLFLRNLSATREGNVLSPGVWEQRSWDFQVISDSPGASPRCGHGLRHGPESGELMGPARPRLRWRIFLYRSPAHLDPRPSTSEVPCWMTHSWLHLCFRKYWVEIALALAPVPQWSHSRCWSILMRCCLNYILQKMLSRFFQKNGHRTALDLKFLSPGRYRFFANVFFILWVWWMKTEATVLIALIKWIISFVYILLPARTFFFLLKPVSAFLRVLKC